MNCQKNASEPQATPLLFVTIFAKTTLAGISADWLPHVVATEKKAAPSSKALRPAVFRQSCNHQFPAPASKKNAALPISSLLVAQSHTPCNRCVRFAATVPSGHAHSLPSRLLYSLLGPDLHRLDRTSFAWRTHSITSSASSRNRITAIANRRGPSSRRPGSSKHAFAAGLLTGREDARLDTVVASASDAHAALVKIKPFWR